MATTKSSGKPRASTAKARARKPASAARRTRDVLAEMLSDVNATLAAIGEALASMPTHGDLHDDHLKLAKQTRKLAKQTHSTMKAARETAKKTAS